MKILKLFLATVLFILPGMSFAEGPVNYWGYPYRCVPPGACYLFHEKVGCSSDGFTCRGGSMRLWDNRPLYQPIDRTCELEALAAKVCTQLENCPCMQPRCSNTCSYGPASTGGSMATDASTAAKIRSGVTW